MKLIYMNFEIEKFIELEHFNYMKHCGETKKRIRGHYLKQFLEHARLNVTKESFSLRVTNFGMIYWKKL